MHSAVADTTMWTWASSPSPASLPDTVSALPLTVLVTVPSTKWALPAHAAVAVSISAVKMPTVRKPTLDVLRMLPPLPFGWSPAHSLSFAAISSPPVGPAHRLTTSQPVPRAPNDGQTMHARPHASTAGCVVHAYYQSCSHQEYARCNGEAWFPPERTASWLGEGTC